MTQLSRVVWSEGMHLAQHHFQAQSRYFEDSIQFAISHLFFKPYGLVAYQFDTEALRNGIVSLLHARGVMPDGLAFHMPDSDPLPAPRDVRNLFSPIQDSRVVLLIIPPYRRGASNCAAQGAVNGQGARFTAETRPVLDDTTGRDERPVSFGRKNFSLALDSEIEEEAVSLPLARVRRDGTGSFIYDPEYIPPCVQIGASDRLMELLRRLIEMFDAKSDALTRGRQGSRRQQGEYSGHDVATFWLLHAIRSSVAPLRHFMQVKRTHPEQLYVELSRLAGALCTFALDSHPRSLPLYDHDNLEASFDALDRHIREHLEIIIPSNCVSIPLRAARPYFTGPVADKRCFGPSRWIFGIRSTAGHAEVITRVPQLVKVCASRYTPELVRRAYPGLPLGHMPSPPPAISPRLDSQYFSVAKEGRCWDTLVQTGEVGIYVPDSLPNAEVELLVLIES